MAGMGQEKSGRSQQWGHQGARVPGPEWVNCRPKECAARCTSGSTSLKWGHWRTQWNRCSSGLGTWKVQMDR